MGGALRTAWYRFTTTLARRRGGYVTLVVLIGLVGGLAMGSIAGARRTESSFPAFVRSTDPSDLDGVTALYDPGGGSFSSGYNPSILRTIAHLPHVARVGTAVGLNTLLLGRHGDPVSTSALPAQPAEGIGIVGGDGVDLDRVTVTEGRLFDPSRRDEVVMSAYTAKMFGAHLGQRMTFGVYSNAQAYLPGFGTSKVPPLRVVKVALVGIVVSSDQVVEDDADVAGNANVTAFTPALTRPLLGCCAYFSQTGAKVDGGAADAAVVQGEIQRSVHEGLIQFQVEPTAGIVAKAQRAIKPESIALGVFGAICGFAALLIGAQIIGRQLRLGAEDLSVERALGADRVMTTADGLIGIGGSVVIGSLVAALVAVAISPLAPLGPARPVDPTPGVSFDWTVLAGGVSALMVVLGAVSLLMARRLAPHRMGPRRRQPAERRSTVAGATAGSGLPESAVTGIRFALEPGAGRNAVPVRSAILGAALAVVVVVATVTFGASLNTLVSSPALYGWNWNYDLTGIDGSSIPQHQVAGLLHADHDVSAWSGVYFLDVQIDGQSVPAISETPGAAVAPPELSGHGVESDDEVVLGQQTLDQLHKRVGDTVVMNDGDGVRRTLHVVGTATMPTINNGGSDHTEIGTGALVSTDLLSGRILNANGVPADQAGPQAILIRVHDSTDPSTALPSLRRIARATTTPLDDGISVVSVQRPAEIVNYRTMGSTPAILGAGLAAGAVAALSLTLIASVRRRRRELALMKTLGFTRRQLAAAVAWQSTVAVLTGTVVGVPVGIIVGRTLWQVFAHEIDVIPTPTVPAVTVALIALGALVLANVVAALPGRIAARTPTAVLLRTE